MHTSLEPDPDDSIGHLESLYKFWVQQYTLRIASGVTDRYVQEALYNVDHFAYRLRKVKDELVPRATVLPASAGGGGEYACEPVYPVHTDSDYAKAIYRMDQRMASCILGGSAVIEPVEDPEEKARKEKFWADARVYSDVTSRSTTMADTWGYDTWYREYMVTGMSWPLENMILAVKPDTVTNILDGRHYDEPVPKGYKKKTWHDHDGRPHEYIGPNTLTSFKAHPVVNASITVLMILAIILITVVAL